MAFPHRRLLRLHSHTHLPFGLRDQTRHAWSPERPRKNIGASVELCRRHRGAWQFLHARIVAIASTSTLASWLFTKISFEP